MANMTFKANLLPNSDLGYSLGSSEQKWKINGQSLGTAAFKDESGTWAINISGSSASCTGNAATATKISSTPNNTTTFLRGDNTWSNALYGGLFIADEDASLRIYSQTNSQNYADSNKENLCIQTCFDNQDPKTHSHVSTYENRCNLVLQPRGGQVYIGRNLTSLGDTNYSLIVDGGIYGTITSATALTSSAGSSTVPIYFSSGKPVQCSTTLGVNITGSSSSCSGNAASATKLQTARTIYGQSFNGTANINTKFFLADDGSLAIYTIDGGANCGNETVCLQSCFDGADPQTHSYVNSYEYRCNIAMQPRGGQVFIGTYPGSGSGNTSYTLTNGGGFRTYGDILIDKSSPMIKLKGRENGTHLYFYASDDSHRANISWIGNCDSNAYLEIKAFGSCDIRMGTSSTNVKCLGRLYGAVWNDYAEYRKNNLKETQEPGRCVREIGDGSLTLTTKRLERGCEIISDTFGFAIGQDEENGYNTPIASNGRVLAYPYESIEEFSSHIGWPVCSGPNGTVSIMTEEEEEKYSSRIIGTISEIPTYEVWGTGNVSINGRVWIRIK